MDMSLTQVATEGTQVKFINSKAQLSQDVIRLKNVKNGQGIKLIVLFCMESKIFAKIFVTIFVFCKIFVKHWYPIKEESFH